jgi:hypothetical protein
MSAAEIRAPWWGNSRYVLRCDFYRYFPAIDYAILKSDFPRVPEDLPRGEARGADRHDLIVIAMDD